MEQGRSRRRVEVVKYKLDRIACSASTRIGREIEHVPVDMVQSAFQPRAFTLGLFSRGRETHRDDARKQSLQCEVQVPIGVKEVCRRLRQPEVAKARMPDERR